MCRKSGEKPWATTYFEFLRVVSIKKKERTARRKTGTMATTTTSGGRNSWVKPSGCRRPPNRPSIKTECVFSLFFSIRKENNGAQKIEYLYLLCAVAPAWGVNNPFRFSFTVSQSIAMHFGVCFCFFRRGFLAILFFYTCNSAKLPILSSLTFFFFLNKKPKLFFAFVFLFSAA